MCRHEMTNFQIAVTCVWQPHLHNTFIYMYLMCVYRSMWINIGIFTPATNPVSLRLWIKQRLGLFPSQICLTATPAHMWHRYRTEYFTDGHWAVQGQKTGWRNFFLFVFWTNKECWLCGGKSLWIKMLRVKRSYRNVASWSSLQLLLSQFCLNGLLRGSCVSQVRISRVKREDNYSFPFKTFQGGSADSVNVLTSHPDNRSDNYPRQNHQTAFETFREKPLGPRHVSLPSSTGGEHSLSSDLCGHLI